MTERGDRLTPLFLAGCTLPLLIVGALLIWLGVYMESTFIAADGIVCAALGVATLVAAGWVFVVEHGVRNASS